MSTVLEIDVTDADLLREAQRGDRSAFGTLYDRHIRAVYWQTYSVLNDPDLAQESTQEVFVTLWRRIREVSLVDASLLPWLLTTAKYTALNAARFEGRRRGPVLDESQPDGQDVEAQVEQGVLRAEIDKAVAALSPQDRKLYALCIEEELSYENAALALGVSHGSVRNRLSRLRAQLRADLRAIKEAS